MGSSVHHPPRRPRQPQPLRRLRPLERHRPVRRVSDNAARARNAATFSTNSMNAAALRPTRCAAFGTNVATTTPRMSSAPPANRDCSSADRGRSVVTSSMGNSNAVELRPTRCAALRIIVSIRVQPMSSAPPALSVRRNAERARNAATFSMSNTSAAGLRPMRCVVSETIASTGAPRTRFAPHPLRRRPRQQPPQRRRPRRLRARTRAWRASMTTNVATAAIARGSGTAPAAPLAAAATRWPIAASLRVMRPPMSASAASRRITPAAQRPPNAAQRGVHVTMMASAGDVLGPSLHAPLAPTVAVEIACRCRRVRIGAIACRPDGNATMAGNAAVRSVVPTASASRGRSRRHRLNQGCTAFISTETCLDTERASARGAQPLPCDVPLIRPAPHAQAASTESGTRRN